MPNLTIGQRIGRARRQLGCLVDKDVAVGDLARMLGTSYETVYNWERDAKKPGEKFLDRLSECLGITKGYIMYGAEPEKVEGWKPPRIGEPPNDDSLRPPKKKKRRRSSSTSKHAREA